MSIMKKELCIVIVGLGYVGLPLAIALSKKFKVIGFDINEKRVNQLKNGKDITGEITSRKRLLDKNINYTSLENEIENQDVYIIAVPTPVNKSNQPDFYPLEKASKLVGKCIKKGSIIIYESTVFPGATEEICVPILEKYSKLKPNKEFFYGYSPERINPSDKKHKIENIVKVVSGSTKHTSREINNIYSKVIKKTFMASSIKAAEAAKVIENTQRDINIALMNELSKFFAMIDLNTKDVLDAANTKWNFINFKPGLVGGHCIGVDPYYLTHKMHQVGYIPKLVLSGREVNESMSKDVVSRVMKLMSKKKILKYDAKILVLGFTFKENCNDFRNTKVGEICDELNSFGFNIDIYDPYVDEEISKAYNFNFLNDLKASNEYDVLILAVSHNYFLKLGMKKMKKLMKKKSVIFDIQSKFPIDEIDGAL